MPAKRTKMAIIYDFDGTLAPRNMQEHRFLPNIGVKSEEFWAETKTLAKQHQADEVLTYMHLMLKKADAANVPVRRTDFEQHGRNIALFDGVDDWFDRVRVIGDQFDIRVEHYLVSSGNEEIIAGSPIANKFTKIYASKFIFDQNGTATWPALAINYTTKTQYLFRINKDAHDLSDQSKINSYIARENRPIPFENMVYIGDGVTDVPYFRMVKDLGGLSIAVYKPNTKGARQGAEKYLQEGRVHHVTPARYTPNSKLEQIVKAYVTQVAARTKLAKLIKC